MKKEKNKIFPTSFKECFYFDEHKLNPVPRGWVRKFLFLTIFSKPRYSMSVYMRLTQFFYIKSLNSKSFLFKKLYFFLSFYFRRLNIIKNNFEHSLNPKISAGVIFHHTGVCITDKTQIESGVHIYRNVTFGIKNGGAPYIKKEAKIGSHSIILGNVIIGKKAIVAPGAVVVKSVPDFKVVAGVPAKVVGDVTEENYQF